MSLRVNYTMTPDLTFELYAAPFTANISYSDVRELSATPRAPRYDDRFQPYTAPAGTQMAYKVTELRGMLATMEAHHGVFIACPEYNASVTPLLKNTLDWISRVKDDAGVAGQVYRTRVFALGAASPGALGGMRGLIHMRTVMELGLGALVLPDQISVPHAMTAFSADCALGDKVAEQRFEAIIQKLAQAARIMRSDAE